MNSRLTYAPQQEAQARAICTALGQGWILRNASGDPDEYHDWHLRRVEDGLELNLSWPDGYVREKAEQASPIRRADLRLTITGVWPRDHAQQTAIPTRTELGSQVTSISVDLGKPAAKIAQEIVGRLLHGGFETLYRRSMEIVRSRNAYGDLTEATLTRILCAIPGSYRGQNSKTSIYFRQDNHAYTVSVQGDSVRFESFSAPADAAIAALRVLSVDQCVKCGRAIDAEHECRAGCSQPVEA